MKQPRCRQNPARQTQMVGKELWQLVVVQPPALGAKALAVQAPKLRRPRRQTRTEKEAKAKADKEAKELKRKNRLEAAAARTKEAGKKLLEEEGEKAATQSS